MLNRSEAPAAETEKARRNEDSGAGSVEADAERIARVWLYGRLHAPNVPRPMALKAPKAISARGVILMTGERLHGSLSAQLLSLNGQYRVFVNGQIVEDLDLPLEAYGERSDIEIILLPPIEGG